MKLETSPACPRCGEEAHVRNGVLACVPCDWRAPLPVIIPGSEAHLAVIVGDCSNPTAPFQCVFLHPPDSDHADRVLYLQALFDGLLQELADHSVAVCSVATTFSQSAVVDCEVAIGPESATIKAARQEPCPMETTVKKPALTAKVMRGLEAVARASRQLYGSPGKSTDAYAALVWIERMSAYRNNRSSKKES